MRNITLVDLGAGPIPAQTPAAARNAAWFPVVYQPAVVPPVTGGGSTPVADGVLLEWDAIESGGAEVTYIIERSADPLGPWDEVARTTATRYLYSDGSGATWYFRIIPTVRGQSGPSEVIEGVPNPVTARLVEIQQQADQATHDATASALTASAALTLMGEAYDLGRGYPVDEVVYFGGKMYRAKQVVPAGTPPPNATYWADVGTVTQAQGNSTLAMQQLRTDLDEQGSEFAAAITSVRSTSGGSGNLVANADYGRGTEGISLYWNEAGATNYLLIIDGAPGRRVGFFVSGAPSVPNASVWWRIARVDGVEVGKTLIGQFRYGGVRNAMIILVFYDASGNQLPQYTAYGQWGRGATGAVLNESSYATLSVSGAVPAGAVSADLVFAMRADGAGDFGYGLRPMVEIAKDGQTAPSPWAPGAGGLAQVTQTLSVGIDSVDGRMKAKQTLTTDVNGNIAGYVSENDGSRSSFSILATIFRVIGSATSGLEWQSGYLRAYSSAIQLVLGINFGASSNLCFWYGPNVGASNCTKGNGTIWFDNIGGAYFGGSLSAGVKKNSVQTTTTVTVGTELVNGPFDTNGNLRNVSISFARNMNYTSNASGNSGFSAGSGSNTAIIQVYRKIGTNAETLWETLVVGGGVDILNEFDGPDRATSYWSGSKTVNDTSPAGSTVTYRSVITGFTSQGVSHPGTINNIVTSQNLANISIEN